MSETDDTDVLLLIPPDFFLVRSSGSEESLLESSRTVVHKPPSCTAQVIGKLVDQVHSLESRLESLEINTSITDSSVGTVPRRKNWDTDSVDSNKFDSKYFTFPRRRRRKVAKKGRVHELSLTSLDSLSTTKSIPRLKLKEFEAISLKTKTTDLNDSKSMEGDISSIVSTPSKKNDKLLLNEIDEFLTKVEAYETPDSKYKELESSLSPENVIKATSDYVSNRFDKNAEIKLPSGRTMSSAVLDKYIYLVKSNPTSAANRNDEPVASTSGLKTSYGEEISTNCAPISATNTPPKVSIDTSKNATETKSPSMRRLNFTDKEVQPTSTPKKSIGIGTSYLETFRPSSNKIYDRASKVLEQYKAQSFNRTSQNSTTDYLKEEFKMPQMRPFPETKESFKNKLIESIDTDLLSLSDLWGERGDRERGDNGKLEEERLKREHCESLIQQLQKKLLDQQEKLAVAMKVDRAKDAAIAKLKDAWLKLTGSLDRAEDRHRQALDKMIREVDNFKQIAGEAEKKTNHFETELYKTLDLAHDYQEKCKQLNAQNKELQTNMEQALASKEEIIARKDNEIEVLKDNYETVMRLNKQSTDCVKNLEDALEKEKSDHEITKNKIPELLRNMQERDDECNLLRQEKDLLKEKVNEERARGNLLERQVAEKQNQNSELLKKCDTLDSEVKALRKHLELQKNELKTHYQKQLEDAVLAKLQEFQQQLDAAEKEMENEARGKEGAILDSFNKQLAQIHEQHKLEINVLEEKQREEIKLYRLQLAQASEKVGLLENKLETYRRRRGQIASQLHSVMEAQWRQALLILTNGNPAPGVSTSSHDVTRADSVATPIAQDYAPPQIPPLTLPFDKRLQRADSAPDRHLNLEGLSDIELQQYVKLLLTRPAGVDFEGAGDATRAAGGHGGNSNHGGNGNHGGLGEEPTSDRADRLPNDRQDDGRRPRRSLSATKPPWKA